MTTAESSQAMEETHSRESAPSPADEVLAEGASLYDQRQEALTSSPPDESRAAELLARIGELLATVEELDVEPEPALESIDSDEVDA